MTNRRARWLLMLVLGLPTTALPAGGLQAGLELFHDDNITLASSHADRLSSTGTRAHVGWRADRARPNLPRLLLSIRGEAVDVARASGLSQAAASVEAGALWRRGRAFSAPTLGVLIAGGQREFDSDLRDATWGRLRAVVHSQWTTRIGLHAGAFLRTQRADHAVFDQNRMGLEGGADWLAGNTRRLYLDLSLSDGDTTVLARPPAPVAMGARDIAADDAFEGYNAYRVDARGAAATLGVTQRLTAALALQASVQAASLKADGGSRYTRHAATLGLRLNWR